jgi:lipid-A-disaccharide synthase
LQHDRPRLQAVIGAANARIGDDLSRAVRAEGLAGVHIVAGTRAAIENADAAFVASGTAVLECALCGVPSVALYIVSPALERYIRRAHTWRYVTLPNIILEREVLPELLQGDATPERLALEMETLLRDPRRQYDELAVLHEALGPPDALERCAAFIAETAAGKAA